MSAFADLLEVLHEDNHLIAVNKPSGWASAHFEGNDQTVDQLVKGYLKEKYQKPGNVFLGVVHRIDKPVSGCLLFARTSKAAARLSEQFRDGAVEKTYWAVVETGGANDTNWLQKETGALEDWLLHDDAAMCVKVVKPDTPGAKIARLFYEVRARQPGLVLLELRPQTGRKHQLRVQLASRGTPIYADSKYGSSQSLGHAIALHARSLTVLHPTLGSPLTLTAELPKHLRGRFARLLA